MSTYYLLDHFTSQNPIIDVAQNDIGQIDSTGVLVVRVPAGVAIHGQPRNFAELNAAKVIGLLARYSGFSNCLLDPCTTMDRIDAVQSSKVIFASGTSTLSSTNPCLLVNGSQIVTPKLTLDVAPTTYAVVWEAYAVAMEDPIGGRTTRRYLDRDSSVLSCSVTFDDASQTTTMVASGATQQYTAGSANVTLKFVNLSSERVCLGSWAILYKA